MRFPAAVLLALPLYAHDPLPLPQKLSLEASTFRIDSTWRIEGGGDAAAVEILRDELKLRPGARGPRDLTTSMITPPTAPSVVR